MSAHSFERTMRLTYKTYMYVACIHIFYEWCYTYPVHNISPSFHCDTLKDS